VLYSQDEGTFAVDQGQEGVKSNVLSHERFLIDEAQLTRLREMGVDIKADIPTDKEMSIKPPAAGEDVVGHATDEEMKLYAALWKANSEGGEVFLSAVKDVAAKTLTSIEGADTVQEAVKRMVSGGMDDAIKARLWEQRQRYAMLFSMFWYGVGHRLELHHHRLGIRSNRRIVSLGARQ
jgi:hypothetical protein